MFDEFDVVPPPMPYVLLFGMPVAYLVCSADVINGGMMISRIKSKKLGERPVLTALHPPRLLYCTM
jgi:hypothetical protein